MSSSKAEINIDDINPDNYILCVNQQGHWIIDNDNVLLLRKKYQQMVYIHKKMVEKNFNILKSLDSQNAVEPTSESVNTEPGNSEERCTWNRTEVLKLISLYKKYKEHFQSGTMRNDKVWQLIANELATHNAIQCKNKWKYLKSKYFEKKDNMSAKASGAKVMKFYYLEEFDDLFKDNANVTPVAIASSSNGIKNIKETGSLTSTENQKKRKKSILEKQLERYNLNMAQREQDRNNRHQEKLARQDQALQIFGDMAATLAKLVKKPDTE